MFTCMLISFCIFTDNIEEHIWTEISSVLFSHAHNCLDMKVCNMLQVNPISCTSWYLLSGYSMLLYRFMVMPQIMEVGLPTSSQTFKWYQPAHAIAKIMAQKVFAIQGEWRVEKTQSVTITIFDVLIFIFRSKIVHLVADQDQ